MLSAEQTSNAVAPPESSSAQQIKTPPPQPQLEVSQAFHHQDSKYKCCCGCMHAKTGAMIIAILSAISLFYLIYVSIGFINNDEKRWFNWAALINWILLIPVVICLFVGLFTKNQYLLLPYIFREIISVILSVTLAIILIYTFSTAESDDIKEAKKRMGIESYNVSNGVIIGAAILQIILELSFTAWFIWVIFLCYRYFRDVKNFPGQTFIGREP
uniref:DUF7027 domain-containing protein n=1 Tax=Panagrolaimus davidi TaxID=227884 RepID=A0A914PTS8_9BILA